MSVATFLTSKGLLIGAAGVVAAGAIAFGVTQAMDDEDPSAAPSPGDTTTAPTATAGTPKPIKTPVTIATPSAVPTAPITAPPTIAPPAPIKKLAITSFTVSPNDMYETWNPSSNSKCHSTDDASSPNDYTYAKLKATITGPGVTSAKVTFSYKGHSGGGGMDKDDSTHWSTAIGGWTLEPPDYYNYSQQPATFVLTVRDRQGHTATATRSNTLHGCHASKD